MLGGHTNTKRHTLTLKDNLKKPIILIVMFFGLWKKARVPEGNTHIMHGVCLFFKFLYLQSETKKKKTKNRRPYLFIQNSGLKNNVSFPLCLLVVN